MKVVLSILLLMMFTLMVFTMTNLPQTPDYESLKAEAEKLYEQGSYSRAYDLYTKATSLKLSPKELRWVNFRLADTTWRSQAATQTADNTKLEQARQQLEVLVRDIQRVEDRDLVWVEVQESLGDYYWQRNNSRSWGQAAPYYAQALDWWAGSKNIDLARQRYLKIVFGGAKPRWAEPYYYYGYYGNTFAQDVIENAVKIAQTDNDRAHANYLLAITLSRYYYGNGDQRLRVPDAFEAALKIGKASDWYDDALYNYGQWMEQYGHISFNDYGQELHEPDYAMALTLYRRILAEFQKGETRYYDQAKNQIDNITKPQLSVAVSNIFLPESEIQYYLNWRNVSEIDFTLYKFDFQTDFAFQNKNDSSYNWLQNLTPNSARKFKSWTKQLESKGDYKPGSENVDLKEKLPKGAYLLEAKSGGIAARELILVTDASLVLKTSGNRALAYFCNALTGAPIAGANIKLWKRYYRSNEYVWEQLTAPTDAQGLAMFKLPKDNSSNDIFATASYNDSQAYSLGYNYGYSEDTERWKIYAFTDRPAYRPNDEVKWKYIARKYNGSVYATPVNAVIRYEITDPQGTKIKEGRTTLNTFGSAFDSLELKDNAPLGEYHINFVLIKANNGEESIGSATLFRIEEYKLPEFKVSVKTPEEQGKKKAFRIGEKVEVEVAADYYFGGPVANANVQLVVKQKPYYQYYYERRDFPWFYSEDAQRRQNYYGDGQVIKQETIKTDKEGRAKFFFETPRGSQQDFEYQIEARVTDSSRREILASDNVRVTRQRYYVYPRPDHYLYRPQDQVKIKFKAQDANEQPVEAEGKVKVVRDYWYEIWLDPKGQEVKGRELQQLRDSLKQFPPAPVPGSPAWQLKFQGYEHEDILTQTVQINKEGEGELSFKAPKDGYYRIYWTSKDGKSPTPITAETTAWVITNASTDIGYRYGTPQIIVDKDTFRTGQKASVMLTVPTPNKYVLFTVEGEGLYSYELVHLTGTSKLVELPIEQKHVPNVFLSAIMVDDRQIFSDVKEIIVPPVDNFLKVNVQADRVQYQPRETGTLTVTTTDQDGKPVSAEVALGLVDESIYYIQQDYAGDPRQFYFGTKRSNSTQLQSTFQQKSYVRLIRGYKDNLIDERNKAQDEQNKLADERQRRQKSESGELDAVSDSAAGFGAGKGGAMNAPAAPVTLAASAPGAARAEGALNKQVAQEATKEKASKRDAGKDQKARADGDAKPNDANGTNEPNNVQVRSDFRATALWQPTLMTDAQGRATVQVKYPDSLTTWKAVARVSTNGDKFGIGDTATRTKQPLIVRLQAPRFFLVGDLTTVSAIINNNTDEAQTVQPNLLASGVVVTGLFKNGKAVKGEQGPVTVPANGEARVDWVVSATNAGEAKLKAMAGNKTYADAMENYYTIYEHGIEKFVAKSGKMRGDDLTVNLTIPKERKAGSTSLQVQVAPSMATTMLDALPYLISYPYGCTEQTMSRFLPAAITAKTMKDLGLQPEDVMGKVFGGIEPGYADKVKDKKQDLTKLNDMVKKGLDRLYDLQHSDGGWGWWKEGETDRFMTAYVVWGLTLAHSSGITIKTDVLTRGANYLDTALVQEELNYDSQAWMLHALASYQATFQQGQASKFQKKAFDNIWEHRDNLNAYTRALLALSAHYLKDSQRAQILIQNLENGVKIDNTPDVSIIEKGGKSHAGVIGTAHWGEDGIYYRWSEGGVEATSFALRALLTVDPQNRLIEPVTNWLIKNRRGAQWSNTRDTAITVLTLNDYLKQSGELSPNLEYELLVNGKVIATKKLAGADALSAPSVFPVDNQLIKDGNNEIHIRRKSGTGTIYFAAQAQFFSLEEPIKSAGNEIFVKRDYYRIITQPTLLKGYVYDQELMQDGAEINSGERIKVVLTIEAKNNYEYLLFEDLKPAGIEAVQIRSGEPLYAQELKSSAVERQFAGNKESANTGVSQADTKQRGDKSEKRQRIAPPTSNLETSDYTGRNRFVYQELRDRKVALFIDKLPEGVWQITYEFRAEIPGQFHALPVLGHAMYVPEIRCNSNELRVQVLEAKEQ